MLEPQGGPLRGFIWHYLVLGTQSPATYNCSIGYPQGSKHGQTVVNTPKLFVRHLPCAKHNAGIVSRDTQKKLNTE